MENKAHALAAGIFILAMTLLLGALAAWLNRDTGIHDTYEISTREIVTGLQEQAPVRYRGVDVGKVSKIGFDPTALGNVLIELDIDHGAPLATDTFATLSYQGVTGLAFVQLGDTGKGGPRPEPRPGEIPRIPLQPGLLARIEAKGEVIMDRVEQISARVNRLLSDDNQKTFSAALTNFGSAAASASQLAQRLDQTVATKLDPVLADTTQTLRAVRQSADEVGATAADFRATARRLNEKDGPIDRLAEGTQALSHAADAFNTATLPRINRVTEEASRAVRQLGRSASSVNENPQSLIFGTGQVRPGPGEPGFAAPGAKP